MTRCAKFHHLFDEVGNFCGMSPSAISHYKAYRQQVDKLVRLGLDEDFVFENFPEGPGRVLANIKDDDTRTKALNFVAAKLKDGEKVSEGDLREKIKEWNGGETCNIPTRSKKLTNVNSPPLKTERVEEKPPLEHAFAPLHDGEPVDPPQALSTQMDKGAVNRADMQEAAKNQPALPGPEETIPCKAGKPCPGGRNYLIKQQVLGDKCATCGSLIRNLPGNICPIIQRWKAAEANGAIFSTGGAPRPVIDERPAALSGLPRATSGPPSLTIKPNERQWNVLKQIVREDLAETLEEAVLYLIDEKADQMEAH